jgi:quinol-cytochrome oxidoreductase complex cytochrome b subunit
MGLQNILAYSLVIIFFIALPILSVLVFAESPPQTSQSRVEEGAESQPSKLAYGLVVVLFALLVVLTFISEKAARHEHAASMPSS